MVAYILLWQIKSIECRLHTRQRMLHWIKLNCDVLLLHLIGATHSILLLHIVGGATDDWRARKCSVQLVQQMVMEKGETATRTKQKNTKRKIKRKRINSIRIDRFYYISVCECTNIIIIIVSCRRQSFTGFHFPIFYWQPEHEMKEWITIME